MSHRPAPPGPADDTVLPLVGREREQALLAKHLAAALAGRGSLVLIGGEAGIGKTALAEALGREAEAQGALVVVGRCYDLSETPPYGPWTEAFTALPAERALAPLPAPLGHGDPATSQATLFAQTRASLAALAAQQPLLLLLDDLHWADPASLDLLRSLARQVATLPMLLLVTYRSDEVTRRHPLAQLVPLLVREARAVRLDLRALDEEAVRGLVQAQYDLGADEGRLVAYLRAQAEGSPFYIGELLRTLEEERLLRKTGDGRWALGDLGQARVPTMLRHVIERRLARLGEDAQRLLAIAAVIGQEVPLRLWSAVSDADDDTLLDVIERAVEARIVEATADGARFAHALIREALYEGMLPLRRRQWHLRAGEALAAQPSPDPDAVAHHLRQAGDPRAAAWLLRAGERAQRAYAWLTAAERYEAALPLLEAGGIDAREHLLVLRRLAQTRFYSDARPGLGYLEEAARLVENTGDPALSAAVRFELGFMRGMVGDVVRSLDEMRAGLATLAALPADERARLAGEAYLGTAPDEHYYQAIFVLRLGLTGRLAEALALGEPLVSELADAGSSSHGHAYAGLAIAYAALGRPGEARDASGRSRAAYRAAGHHAQLSSTAGRELRSVALAYAADDLAERQRLAAEAEEAARRALGTTWFLPAMGRLPLLLVEGRWAEARHTALASQRLMPPGTPGQLFVAGVLAALAAAQGDSQLAWGLIREWLPAGPATAPEGYSFFLQGFELPRVATTLAVEAGDLPTAHAWLAAHGRWLAWSGAVLGRSEGQALWAAYHRAAGDPTLARQHAEAALAHATEPRQPLALLAAHRLLGELDTEAGRYAEATTHLDTALALADACAAPYERALTLLALAELRAATGKREEALILLDEVRATCVPLDAKPALARAEVLQASLATAPAAPPAYPGGLTAREVEVLRLVAQGLPNAEVAERLYLSPRTVNGHLTAIYGKLGVASRSAAVRFALDHGLR